MLFAANDIACDLIQAPDCPLAARPDPRIVDFYCILALSSPELLLFSHRALAEASCIAAIRHLCPTSGPAHVSPAIAAAQNGTRGADSDPRTTEECAQALWEAGRRLQLDQL